LRLRGGEGAGENGPQPTPPYKKIFVFSPPPPPPTNAEVAQVTPQAFSFHIFFNRLIGNKKTIRHF